MDNKSTAVAVAVKPAPKAETKKVEKTKAKAKVAKPSKAWAEKYREGTIGRQIAELILAGKLDNDGILKAVKTKNKTAKTTYGCVAWYRSAAKSFGK